jgi:hypothetical protein
MPMSPATGVGQTGATVAPDDRAVVPIPSITPSPYAPRAGSPQTGPVTPAPLTGGGGGVPNDRAPVGQPRLESARPSADDVDPDRSADPGGENGAYWQRHDAPDPSPGLEEPDRNGDVDGGSSESSWYQQSSDLDDRTAGQFRSQIASPSDVAAASRSYSQLRPIAAPDGFRNPFQRRSSSETTRVHHRTLPPTTGQSAAADPRDDHRSSRLDSARLNQRSAAFSRYERETAMLPQDTRANREAFSAPKRSSTTPRRDSTWYAPSN